MSNKQRKSVQEKRENNYNSAKTWQVGFFALNNAATNFAFFMMLYYAFYSQNILGLGAAIVGTIAMAMRLFDAVTDPLIGFFMDKTDGKFGKFRPFMLVGNIIIVTTVLAIFRTPDHWAMNQKYLFTSVMYGLFILGYTLQCTVTKGAQAALTNDPKQRPLFTMFDAVYTAIVYSGGTYFLATVMAPKYPQNMIDPLLWKNASLLFMSASFICTVLAIIGLWEKDRTEFFGLGENAVKVKFKDYVDIIKNNRPIKLLVVAASTDKLASTAIRGAQIYFFSNILLNTALQGKYSLGCIIPVIFITIVGVNYSRKTGIKKAFVGASWISLIMLIAIVALVPILSKTSTGTIILLVIWAVQYGIMNLSTGIVIPMIADCADYETYRSGRFIPGMMGTLFSFVDKMISSLATFIIGMVIAWAGYGNSVIQPNTAVSSKFYIGILFCVFGLPILGHLASIIAMKFYSLDGPMMEKVNKGIADKKASSVIKEAAAAEA
ncbi:MFS transporter [Clostridium sediminicola]|uniref:MFS transporter n=1 Tax=Clostridium sediminicola TaxID=3114879 RepID=UPI0031F1DF21